MRSSAHFQCFRGKSKFDFIAKTTLETSNANMASTQSVQCFGKKKTATAVAHCKASAPSCPGKPPAATSTPSTYPPNPHEKNGEDGILT